jgi:hypothetical protein
MGRYVFLHRGNEPNRADLDRIAATPGVRIVDREVASAMLAEADDGVIEKLRPQLPDWIISPEVFYSKPEPE